jgi:cytoskeletal protein RodZ
MVGVFASTVLLTLPDAERWIARSFIGIVAVAAMWLAAWWWRKHWPQRVAGSPIWTARYYL